MGAHFKEVGTLNLNQYKLSILLWQFFFYKAPNMAKCPKLTLMGLSNTFFVKIDFFQNCFNYS